MAAILQKIWQWYQFAMDEYAAPQTKDWFLISTLSPLIIILTTYVYICTTAGPQYMNNREPYQLKKTILVYNAVQVLLSFYMVYEGLVSGWWNDYKFSCQPVDYSDNPKAVRMASAAWCYFMAKLIELLDTIFFVLRKKDTQITFLHLYHHSTMPLVSWIGARFAPNGHGSLYAVINSFIHIFMYSYYFVSGLGPKYQKYLWWKKHLTTMQLIQFCIIFYHNFIVLFYYCKYPKILNFLMALNSGFFLYMFGRFYVTNYRKRSTDSLWNGNAKVKDC